MALVARLLLNCWRQKRNLLVWDGRQIQREMHEPGLRNGGFLLINKLALCGENECVRAALVGAVDIELNDSMM